MRDSGCSARGDRPTTLEQLLDAARGARGRPPTPWICSGAAMIEPTRLRGFSDAYGSWKTICISRRSGRSSRAPSRAIVAALEAHVARRSARAGARSCARASTCRSPTRRRARASRPRATENVTPSTAWTAATCRREQALADREVGRDVLDLDERRRRSRAHAAAGLRRGSSASRSARLLVGIEPAAVEVVAPPPRSLERGLGPRTGRTHAGSAARNAAAGGRVDAATAACPAIECSRVLLGAVEARDRAEQAPRVRVLRVVEERRACRRTRRRRPAYITPIAVGDLGDDAEVVRDQDRPPSVNSSLQPARSARGSAPGS